MSKAEIRKKIDAIDLDILNLLNERAKLALSTSQFKKVSYDPIREKQIYDRLHEHNSGPLADKHISSIYREVLSACRGLQKQIVVAYLGPRSTFSNVAAIQRFGASIVERPCPDIGHVFDEVEKDVAEYGVVPLENSSEGIINYTLDRFAVSNVRVCGEIYCDVSLNLMAKHEDFSKIEKIYSHSKPLEQCANWLRENAFGKEIIPVESTALAAQKASKSKTSSAIAGAMAAEIYGLKIIQKGLEDSSDNTTRFLIISKHTMPKSGNDKTSVIFTVRHEPGTLYRALRSFEKYGVNLTMMQARPSRQSSWEYMFFIDIQGHQDDQEVKDSLDDIKKETIVLKTLGSYPKATPIHGENT